MRLREFFKTVILTALVVSSVFLASKIWFSEELWSDGYNSFSYTNIFPRISSVFGKKVQVKPLEYNQIFFPKQLMLQYEGVSVLVKPTDSGYLEMSGNIKKTMEKMFESYTLSEITEEEFKKECKSDSVMVDFYNNTSFRMLGDYFGAAGNENTDSLNNIRQILISADEPVVFARDISTKKIFSFSYNGDISEIRNKLSDATRLAKEGQKLYSYAFENGFDVMPEEGNIQDKMLFDSYIIINITGSNMPVIKGENLLNSKNPGAELLNVFNMSIGTSRAFTEPDGTSNFIENYSKVKTSKNGCFVYDCMDNSKGISLGEGLSSDYDVIKKAGEFLERVNSVVPAGEGNGYVFNRIEKNGSEYTVCFDITYNGIPVLINDGEKTENSVEITVDGSRIICYKQYFISFSQTGENYEIKNMITALDGFYSIYSTEENNEVKISDMYNTYYYSAKDSSLAAKWIISLSDNQQVIVN